MCLEINLNRFFFNTKLENCCYPKFPAIASSSNSFFGPFGLDGIVNPPNGSIELLRILLISVLDYFQ